MLGKFVVETKLFNKVSHKRNGGLPLPWLFTKTEAGDELHDGSRRQFGLGRLGVMSTKTGEDRLRIARQVIGAHESLSFVGLQNIDKDRVEVFLFGLENILIIRSHGNIAWVQKVLKILSPRSRDELEMPCSPVALVVKHLEQTGITFNGLLERLECRA